VQMVWEVGGVLVPEFILCKGKAVEESWVFRENKEISLARARKN